MAKQKRISLDVVKRLEDGSTAWDPQIKGFGIRRQGNSLTYVLKYRHSGIQRWLSIGRHGSPWTPETARREALELLGLIAAGKDPASTKSAARKAPTVRELGEKFLSEYADAKRKPRTARSYRDVFERIVYPKLGHQRVRDITRAEIARLHSGLSKTPYQANRAVATLSKFFNMAEAWGERADGTNPCRHIVKFREVSRERFLSPAEFLRLGEAIRLFEKRSERFGQLSDLIKRAKATRDSVLVKSLQRQRKALGRIVTPCSIAAITLLIFTGARLSEILELQWTWIDFETATARLPDSKTGAKTIHLPLHALEILARIPRVENNIYVIQGAKRASHLVNLEKPWRAIKSEAKLPDVRLHDLRHSFASVAAASGLSLPIIGKMLGHSQPQTTARYAHLAHSPVETAAISVGKIIAAALGNPANFVSPAAPLSATRDAIGD